MNLTEDILNKIREQYGEAFYLLDSAQFKCNYLELKEAFSKIYNNFNIAYSYKTNYTPKLCSIVNEFGGYAEVVSEMELELALKIGVKPQKIIWNGPIKDPQVLEMFLVQGGTVNIDSIEEFVMIEQITQRHLDAMFNIGIRCNFDVNDGVLSRFGFDIDGEDFQKVLSSILRTDNIKLINLQCHFAKRQVEYWPARAKGMIELLDRIGIVPERMDLGGDCLGKWKIL